MFSRYFKLQYIQARGPAVFAPTFCLFVYKGIPYAHTQIRLPYLAVTGCSPSHRRSARRLPGGREDRGQRSDKKRPRSPDCHPPSNTHAAAFSGGHGSACGDAAPDPHPGNPSPHSHPHPRRSRNNSHLIANPHGHIECPANHGGDEDCRCVDEMHQIRGLLADRCRSWLEARLVQDDRHAQHVRAVL